MLAETPRKNNLPQWGDTARTEQDTHLFPSCEILDQGIPGVAGLDTSTHTLYRSTPTVVPQKVSETIEHDSDEDVFLPVNFP